MDRPAGDSGDVNIAEILRDRAARAGGQPAIIDRGGQVTFAELDRAAARHAARCEAAGLGRGDRVLVVVPVSIRLYAVLIGVFRIGATTVLLDPSAGRADLNRCCRLAGPRGFLASPRAHLLRLVSSAVRAIPVKKFVSGRFDRADAARRARIETCEDDWPALLTFTSGSTGEPKAAMRTHGFLLAQHRALEHSLQLRPGAIDLTALPVFVLSNLASGVTSLIPDADLRRPGAIDPAPVLDQIQRYRPASVVASPAFLDRVVSHAIERRVTLDSFERIFTGGAPVFPRLLRKIQRAAPRAAVTAVYGSTEAEPIAHIDLADITADDFAKMQAGAGLLAGAPVREIDLRVIADRWGTPLGPYEPHEFAATAVSAGDIGEIVVTGGHVLRGYLNGTGDSETKVRVGDRMWHRTGDAGYLDADGRLWLMGRCSARISDGDGTLYPFAVECAACGVPGVARAALTQGGGKRLLAVQLDPDAPAGTHAALLDALRWANLAGIVPVRAIPVDRRHNAKVDYPALQKLIERSVTSGTS